MKFIKCIFLGAVGCEVRCLFVFYDTNCKLYMTKEVLKGYIAELQSDRREKHIEPSYVDYSVLSREVSSLAIAEMKKNLRALYESGEIEIYRTLNGTSINVKN